MERTEVTHQVRVDSLVHDELQTIKEENEKLKVYLNQYE